MQKSNAKINHKINHKNQSQKSKVLEIEIQIENSSASFIFRFREKRRDVIDLRFFLTELLGYLLVIILEKYLLNT